MSTQIATAPSAPPAILQRPADMLTLAQSLEIKDQISFDAAGELRKICKTFREDIVAANAEPKKTAFAAHKAATARETKELAPIDAADKLLKGKREVFSKEQDDIKKALQKKADEEAAAKAKADREAEALTRIDEGGTIEEIESIMSAPISYSSAPVQTITKTEGISSYYKYSAELVDAKAFVNAALTDPSLQGYLIPDEAAISTLAQAQQEAFSVPGFELKKKYVEPVRS